MSMPNPARSRRIGRFAAIAGVTAAALGFSALSAPAAFAAPVTATIADVQGDAQATPLAGQVVTVEGVITGDYRASTGSGYRGFYLQTAGSGGATDATPGRSDGIFVFSAAADPAVGLGDLVRVTGATSEFNGQTQISATDATAYELVASGASATVTPTVLPNAAVGVAREAFEGMLVTPEAAYLSSSHQLFNFGTLWLNAGELAVKATETTDAGADAAAIAAANRANRLLVDDGYSIQVSNAAHPGEQPYFAADTVVRNGDTFVAPAAGMILGWGFDDWRLQPQRPLSDTSPADYAALEPTFEPLNPRTTAPEAVGGDITAASFNVFNYFTTFGGEARGADDEADFLMQQSKIVAAINALGADVVGLMEIENSVKLGEPADEALANLISALNAASAPGTWAYVPTPAPLLDAAITDYITNAIIYKPATVTPVGDSLTAVDETVWDIAREPIAQTFESVTGGKIVTVVANHFKSKSPPSGNTAPEPADLQGFFNAERVEQANALVTFTNGIAADPAKGSDILLVGDFNAYGEEDPVQVLTDAGFVDLAADRTDEYTYSFDGELGSLDHAFASASLAASVTGVDIWTINSPEWSDRGYAFAATEAGTPYRSSDHDPIIVGISAAAAPVDIDILSINDFHGRLEAAPPIAGAAVLAGMVDSYRAANPNTTFVAAGDLIGASTFTSFIQNDEPTIDAFNEMQLNASAFGNHEFDQGREDVDNRILPRADWDYLSANIYDRATGEPAYQEYYLQEFGDVTVGFVGAMTEELPSLVSPAGIATLEVRQVVPEVNRVADELSDGDAANGEADVIVLLVHEGAATPNISSATDDSAFGRIVTGANANIDAIISGHTHLAYDHEIPIPGTDVLRPVISSGQYGEKYSHMDLQVDPTTGDILSIGAEVLPLAGAFAPDPEVAAIVADAVAVAQVEGAVQVGEITGDFNRARQTGATFAENRGGESTLGNFVADVQQWAILDAGADSDFALMNPGGLRADLKFASSGAGDPEGAVSFREAAAVQPFANTLVTLDLTGAQLKSVLEEQWQPAGASRPFLKLGVSEALEYTYDPGAPVGDHIDAIYVNDVLVTPSDTFTVTVNSFLASGGDSFTTLAQGANAADSGRVDLQSMVDYFEANPVAGPDYAQRSVGVSVTAPASADGYAPGEQVTLTLSSLLFSNDGPRAGSVVVSAGGVELGTAPIDPAIVDTTDESGRASVTITIPDATAAGTLVLTVTVPQTGTAIDVPLQVAVSAQPIEAVTAPTITGTPRVGSTLTTTGGTWSVVNPTLAFQWNRNGEPIDGATNSSYRVTAADAGATITVTATATAEGALPGSATSAAVTVATIASSTTGSADRLLASRNAIISYTVIVRASGAVPVGEVTIYDFGRPIATVTLDVDDRGRATVTLPKLGRGLHLLTSAYAGNGQVAGSSTGWPWPVLVY